MDQFSISDRLESTTPVRDPGPENSSRGDQQARKRKPLPPKTDASETAPESQNPAESTDDHNPHQVDELA